MELTHVPPFNAKTRADCIDRYSSGASPLFDAIIVGGGIVGAGAARDLALRGLKVALFEKSDFAWATSSKSSKLIHGGLRYLEMLDFGLVFEALAERHWLLKSHPHLVLPLRFVLPLFEKGSAPSQGLRPPWLMRLGLWLYDTLALFRTPYFHGRFSSDQVLKRFPGIADKGLKGGLYYADAMMRDDELVLECLLDAVRHGAEAINYAEVKSISKRQGVGSDSFHEVTVNDFVVRARQVIVCVGPWTDRVENVVCGGSGRKMKPSRGIHLVVPWSRFPVEDCLVMSAPDGRIVFIIPRKDFGPGDEVVIIGTTDAPEHGDLNNITAKASEVSYLLSQLSVFFPHAKLTEKDVLTTYAGVRPLLDDGHAAEAKTSREHEIWKNSEGITFVAGGKYTTFRPMSKEIGDYVFPKVPSGRSKARISSPEEYATRFGGAGAAVISGVTTESSVQWALEHSMPLTLTDIIFRRTPLWTKGPGLDDRVLQRVAGLAGQHLGWSPERREQEVAATRDALKNGLKWD